MTFKYLEEFMKKKDDKAYIDKMLKIIDGYLDKNKVTNDEGIINDLDKVKSEQ